MRRYLIVLLLTLAPATLAASDPLAFAWPRNPHAPLSELGLGVGVIFSPDLSVPGNCRFYEALGFACFDDADWNRVLTGIRTYNARHPHRRIRTLLLETHGTNGHGLKLQQSSKPKGERSYISVAALQERVEPDGIRYIIISSCNSGRLLRPLIYRTLDPNPGDKLFLPATCGIINATRDFNPRRSRVVVLTPVASRIETSLAADVSELAPVTRRVIVAAAKMRGTGTPAKFAVSDMLMQIILRDSRLKLRRGSPVDQLSSDVPPVEESEGLFGSFVAHLNAIAARDMPRLTAER